MSDFIVTKMCLLVGLENENPESELLTVFTSKNRVMNRNQNRGIHNYLEIRIRD